MLTASDETRCFEFSIPLAGGGCSVVATILPTDWRPVLDVFGLREIRVDDASQPILSEGYRAYADYGRRALVGAVPSVADPEADGLLPADYRGCACRDLWRIGWSIHQAALIELAVFASRADEGAHHAA